MGYLKGKKILITGGPTREFIDPVRFLSNPSTGRMGLALAEASRDAGAHVTLILGPSEIHVPEDIDVIRVVSAEEMHDTVYERAPDAGIIIMTAAVSDYKPLVKSARKIKKTKANITLELERTKDILGGLRDNFPGKIIVGFAAESENIVENAKKKLESKKLDMIVANDITKKGAGFATSTNSVIIIDKSGNIKETGLLTKTRIAQEILNMLFSS